MGKLASEFLSLLAGLIGIGSLVLKILDKVGPEKLSTLLILILNRFPNAHQFVIDHHDELKKLDDDVNKAVDDTLDKEADAPIDPSKDGKA